MRKLIQDIIRVIIVICIAAWTFNITVNVCREVFSPPGGPADAPQAKQAHHPARFYSTIERQRILRDEGIYHGDIDGKRGDLTIAAEQEHAKLYNEWMAKEIAK